MSIGSRSPTLDPTTAHDLLASPRRRRVVAAVAEADDPLDVDQLATMCAAREQSLPPAHLPVAERTAVARDLRQEHVPRLVECGALARAGDGYEAGPNLDRLCAVADATTGG